MKTAIAALLLAGSGVAVAGSRPSVRIEPVTDGIAAKAVKSKLPAIERKALACYRPLLAKQPKLEGNVAVELAIGSTGAVTIGDLRGFGTDVEACVRTALAKQTFGKPQQPEGATVSLQFDFRIAHSTFDARMQHAFDTFGGDSALTGEDPFKATHNDTGGSFGIGVSGRKADEPSSGCFGCQGVTSSGSGPRTGTGYGNTPMSAAEVRLGELTVDGKLDKAIVRRYVRRYLPKLRYCYEHALRAKPDVKGTVNVTFTIEPTGTVTGSTATGVDKSVTDCMATTFGGIEYPKPESGSVHVTYALQLVPPAPKQH
jgi:hypothetical protein